MGLLKATTTCQAGGRRGRRRGGARGRWRGRWWTGRRGGLLKSAGKGRGALTTLWRGGSDTRGGETSPPRGAGSGRPVAGGGRWRDSRSPGGLPTGEERAPLTGGPSPPTGGGRGRPTDGSGRSEPAAGRGKTPAGSTSRAAGSHPSSAGGRTRSAAPTSASEGLRGVPVTFPMPRERRRECGSWNHLAFAGEEISGTCWSYKPFMQMKSYNKKIKKCCAWCILLKKLFFGVFLFF